MLQKDFTFFINKSKFGILIIFETFLMYVWLNLKTIKLKKPIIYNDNKAIYWVKLPQWNFAIFSICDAGNSNFVYNIIDCVNATLKIGDTQKNTLVVLKKIPRHLTQSQLVKTSFGRKSFAPIPSSNLAPILTTDWPTHHLTNWHYQLSVG